MAWESSPELGQVNPQRDGATGTTRLAWESSPELGQVNPLSHGLDRLLKRLDAPGSAATSAVFGSWSELVGEVLAEHSRPLRLQCGELLIAVDDPVWATELRFLEANLVDRLNALSSDLAIYRVKLKVRR